MVDIYIDNGFSGTNFERPAFQKMMEDAKRGKINCIIVKDLSRFGRSYLEAGNYLEKIFPFLNIRFISVTDHFDTFAVISSEDVRGVANGIEIPLKNIINEVYFQKSRLCHRNSEKRRKIWRWSCSIRL